MIKGLKKMLKDPKTLLFIVLVIICIISFSRMKENFEDDIEPNKKEYDDALEKRIAEVKDEYPRFDAELLLDVNRPYRTDVEDRQGWWANVVDGKTNPDIYHKKDSKDWIWPY